MKNTIIAPPWVRWSATVAKCVLALALSGTASAAWAAISVTTLNDTGPGSLRQAIADALPGDMITFSVHGTITLTSGALMIGKNLEIQGPGSYRLRISGNRASRVFVLQPNTSVTLAGMTISDGLTNGDSPLIPSIGGGILNGAPPVNLATNLILSNVVISGNQALGDPSKSPLTYPGAAYGGGVANFGTMSIKDSSFTGNLARGADGISSSTVAGFGAAGGIFSSGKLTIIDSRFTQNQAIGGNNSSSTYLTGHGFGGAIVGGGATGDLAVQDSEFDHNQAIGGNGNVSPKPATVGANKASGGAVDVVGGKATFDRCILRHNLSVGGAGASGADGGIGSGGAILATNFSGANTNLTVSNSRIEHNTARGGPGSAGRDGGEGSGGGLTSTADATLTVISTAVAHNHAKGGQAGEGGNGGNGLGGGLYDNYDFTSPPTIPGPTVLVLQDAIVTKNLALGGDAETGGIDGQGIGGGVYYLGTFNFDPGTVIEKNQASTSNDDVGP